MKLYKCSESMVNEQTSMGLIKTTFVVIESKYGVLLQFNRYRNVWELPGGMIEKGETARSCAIRECMEECSQDVSNALLVGSVKVLYKKNIFQPNDEIRETPIFYKFINDIAPFVPNEEIESITWCSDLNNPPEPYCEISIKIAHAVKSSLLGYDK